MCIKERQFSRLDHALSQYLAERTTLQNKEKILFKQLVARLSFDLNNGHSCISINRQQQHLMQASGMASVDQITPLIIENNKLYFYRYWSYEKNLAKQLLILTNKTIALPNLETSLARYFPERSGVINWQRMAAFKAIGQSFSIITGGPGTGKTTAAVKLLALIVELSKPDLNIALVAPTGKAAMRLQEAVVQNKLDLPCDEEIKKKIPDTCTTIHRLLGTKRLSPYFKHDADNLLQCDLVLIDEASMVDLALMSKLVVALPVNARIILLGDKDQLASFESGAVLADIALALPEHTHEFKKIYRSNKDIQALATAVNRQDSQSAWDLLANQEQNSTGILEGKLQDYLVDKLQDYWKLVHAKAEFKAIFNCFGRFQVLCAHRQGDYGVSAINAQIERQYTSVGQWYQGRPIVITRNHEGMKLYNGDIGICLADPKQQNRLMVYFARPDGSVRKFLPIRLPSNETVFAMTIHKSQGSEFNEVLLVLPNQISPILTKELIYTGITRACKCVKIIARKEIFKAALQQRVVRMGGLVQRLLPPN